ncbi:hypothetical protein BT69DRAFT_1288155 [Atractiella rhizophila]|nr:hypothetical protein BT69DRAFT_1288155 [Atractiella rhizophila]
MSSFQGPNGEQTKSRPTSQYSQHSNTSSSGYQYYDAGAVPPSRSRFTHPPEHFVIVRPPPSSTTHPLNLQVQLVLSATSNVPNIKSASRSSTLNSVGALQIPSDPESGLRDSFTAVAVATPVASHDEVEGGDTLRDDGRGSRLSRSPSTSSVASTTESNSSGTRKNRVMALYNLSWHNVLTTTVTDAGTDEKIAKFLRKGESIEIIGLAEIMPSPLFSSPTAISASPSSTSLSEAKNGSPAVSSTSSLLGRFKKTFMPKADALTRTTGVNNANSIRTSIETPKLNVFHSKRQTSSTSNSEVNVALPEEGVEDIKRAKAYRWVVKRWVKLGMTEEAEWSLEWTKMRIPFGPQKDGKSRKFSQRGLSRSKVSTDSSFRPENSGELQTPEIVDEDIDESDPEDSESPWICQLQLPKSRSVTLSNLSPAPHHPRVIAQLTMPYNMRSEGGLTVEELKDMVFVTSLWLLIKERLGGLGIKRKNELDWRSGLKIGVAR